MTEKTKYYCDVCGKEVQYYDSVSMIVIASEGIRGTPTRLRDFIERESDYNGFKHVDTHGHLFCKGCLGEKWQESCELEPYNHFRLKENGIKILEKLRLIKPEILRGEPKTD